MREAATTLLLMAQWWIGNCVRKRVIDRQWGLWMNDEREAEKMNAAINERESMKTYTWKCTHSFISIECTLCGGSSLVFHASMRVVGKEGSWIMTKRNKEQNIVGKWWHRANNCRTMREWMTLYNDNVFEIVANKRIGTDHFRCCQTDCSTVWLRSWNRRKTTELKRPTHRRHT